ncbi:MAG: DUF1850 domain-containing protein [Treponema sp.]|jgi:hypothetical protein|nr:DUF1850 domain-containing protein [Treponema sp.]
MQKAQRKVFLSLCAFCVLCVSFAVTFLVTKPRLELRDADSGKRYAAWPIQDGEEFSIEFIHSVNQSPVRDTFRIDGKLIQPVATRFFDFGAGMQTSLETGQRMERDGDALIITGFTQSFPALNYIVGTVSDHILYIQDAALSLRELCGQNAHITVQVRKF